MGVEHEADGSDDRSAETGPKAVAQVTKAAIDIRRNMDPIYRSLRIRAIKLRRLWSTESPFRPQRQGGLNGPIAVEHKSIHNCRSAVHLFRSL